jgi:hypothetical protein
VQKNLGHISPVAKLKEWQKTHPELFVKKVYNQSRPDTPFVPLNRVINNQGNYYQKSDFTFLRPQSPSSEDKVINDILNVVEMKTAPVLDAVFD